MQIGSMNNYSDIFQNVADSQAKEIKKAALLEELSLRVGMASITADSIMSSLGGYEMDSEIPEDSTVSYHI